MNLVLDVGETDSAARRFGLGEQRATGGWRGKGGFERKQS